MQAVLAIALIGSIILAAFSAFSGAIGPALGFLIVAGVAFVIIESAPR